jgi:hypothetical protein
LAPLLTAFFSAVPEAPIPGIVQVKPWLLMALPVGERFFSS